MDGPNRRQPAPCTPASPSMPYTMTPTAEIWPGNNELPVMELPLYWIRNRRGTVMSTELEKVHEKLAGLEREIKELREGYVIANKRYTEALATLSEMVANAKEAASRAATAAKLAAHATRRSVDAAKEAAAQSVIPATEEAANAAWASAEAASEAAAAAAAAAAVCAATVAHQAEEASVQASADAARAAKAAAEAAAEAVKLSRTASDIAASAKDPPKR